MLVEHTAAGLRKLLRCLQQAMVLEVSIERPDGPIVEALLEAGLTVFVIAPNQIKHLRRRYGAAGNKDDHFDAYVLADTVRTDHHRLRPLTLDSPATLTLRMTVRARKDLIAARVAMAKSAPSPPRTRSNCSRIAALVCSHVLIGAGSRPDCAHSRSAGVSCRGVRCLSPDCSPACRPPVASCGTMGRQTAGLLGHRERFPWAVRGRH
jgi:hypothetical protein